MKHDAFTVPPVLVLAIQGPWSADLRAAILADYDSAEMVAWRAEQRRLASGASREGSSSPRSAASSAPAEEDEDNGPASRDRLSPDAARRLLEAWGNPYSAARGTGIPRAEIREAYLRGGFEEAIPWRRGEQTTRKPAFDKALTREEALEILAWYGSKAAAEKNIGIPRSTIRDALVRDPGSVQQEVNG